MEKILLNAILLICFHSITGIKCSWWRVEKIEFLTISTVISAQKSEADLIALYKKINCYLHWDSTARQRTNYCCLQFSLFSLGFTPVDLSVWRLVGGMNAGSSRKSCKPDGDAGSDWQVATALEGKRTLASKRLRLQFHQERQSHYRLVPRRGPQCFASGPGRWGRAPLRCSWCGRLVCKWTGVWVS